MHPEFGYVGTSSFCRILVALLVCVLMAVASSVIRFKAAPQPDPKDAMALATGEAVSNTPSIPAAIADTYSDKGEFAQRPPNTGATAPTLTSNKAVALSQADQLDVVVFCVRPIPKGILRQD